MNELLRTTSSHPDFQLLMSDLEKELRTHNPELHAQYEIQKNLPDNFHAIVAYHKHHAAGCGCFKPLDPNTVEISRLYVEPSHRGRGIAIAILSELEDWALELGYSRAILETGNDQPEALHLYKKSGYQVIQNYGPYIGMDASVCMAKELHAEDEE
jgi:putative acetyltransferase